MLTEAKPTAAFGAVIAQIAMLDLVFSIDSILTAVGMTNHVPIMVVAVVIAVAVMLLAADPVAKFVEANPSVVMGEGYWIHRRSGHTGRRIARPPPLDRHGAVRIRHRPRRESRGLPKNHRRLRMLGG